MKKRITLTIIGLVLVLALVVSCAPQSTGTATTTPPDEDSPQPTSVAASDKVTVMIDWVPNTNHTGLYVALDKGWYRDQGLDVEIIQPAETGVEQVVATGAAQFGVSYQEQVTNARAQDVPIVSIAAVIQHNLSGFASPRDKNITRPKDFEGKRYGSFGSPTEKQVLEVLMKCDGGDVNKVEFVDIGSSDFFVATQRDVDFTWIFQSWTGVEAEIRDVPLNYIALRDWTDCLPDYYTPVLITSEKLIEENRDLVSRFMSATSQGYEWAINNPDEAADILIKNAPESNPELIKKSQREWLSPQYSEGATRWGEQTLEVWQAYSDWMAEHGLLTKSIDASKAFTNDFLPD